MSSPKRHLIRVHSMAHGGAGVGRVEVDPDVPEGAEGEADGRTWFVDGALPGEGAHVEVIKAKSRWVRSRAVEIIDPSELRVEPPCPIAHACGGCGWQHVRADAQAELKREVVANQLRRLPLVVGDVHPSPSAVGYRRRTRMHYLRERGRFDLGFHRVRTREVIDVPGCPVLEPVLDEAMARVRELSGVLPPRGEVLALTDGREVVFGFPGVAPRPPVVEAFTDWVDAHETIAGAVLRGARQRHSVGQTELSIDGGGDLPPLTLSAFSFSQAQSAQNRALVDHVLRKARASGKSVLELYCGAGNFTRGLARVAKRVRAVDDGREEINGLRRMLGANKLRVDTKRTSVDRLLPGLAEAGKQYEVVVLDPPRGGLGTDCAAALAAVAVERIVYVSCDPATLARDLEAIVEAKQRWIVSDTQVFDMMPMTSEVEVVVVLESRPS